MSRQAKISVMGLYTWDNELFSLMAIPEGLTLETVVDNILTETAELEVLYPNPEVLKVLIGTWSAKMIDRWTELYKTTKYEYNPIENYNRMETGSRDTTGNSKDSGSDQFTGNRTGKSDSYIAGFDSVPSGNNDGLVKQSRDEDMDNSNNTTTYGKKTDQTENTKYENHAHGNIGVTTTQKLIREQREVADFNIYAIIIRDFIDRFCIEVY